MRPSAVASALDGAAGRSVGAGCRAAVFDRVCGLAHDGAEAFEVGVGGVVPQAGGGHGPDETGRDLQRGCDAGGERDVLAHTHHEADLPGGPQGLVELVRVDDGVGAVAGEIRAEHVDAHRGENRASGGAGVQR